MVSTALQDHNRSNSLFWTRNFAEGPWGLFEILSDKNIIEFTLKLFTKSKNVTTIKYSPHIEVLLLLGLKKEAFVAVFHFTHLETMTVLSYAVVHMIIHGVQMLNSVLTSLITNNLSFLSIFVSIRQRESLLSSLIKTNNLTNVSICTKWHCIWLTDCTNLLLNEASWSSGPASSVLFWS